MSRRSRSGWWMLLSVCVALAVSSGATGCNSDPPKEPTARAPSVVTPPAREADTSYRLPARERVVAIGDLHGDLAATRAALRLAGAIDDKDEWVGGALAVVQTGDQLDRGDDEPDILALFQKLKERAEKAGGAFYALNGNHEVMNVAGDFRYVTQDGFADYRGTPPSGPRAAELERADLERRGRAAAFLPGGPVAKTLAERPVVLVVGDDVFVHGGVLPGHVRYGLAKINAETRAWMRGDAPRLPEVLNGDSAPIWTRDYSDGTPSTEACARAESVLAELKAKRMVVGHTVQKNGIDSACGGKVWRIDVGLAKHYGGRTAVLEIRGGQVRPLTAPPQ